MGADNLITPIVGGSVAVRMDRLELGLLGRYEAHYVSAKGENEDAPETSGIVIGINCGLRLPLGSLEVRGGGSLLLAALHEDRGAKDGRAEGRVGAYLGTVWPRHTKTRLRLDLGYELVPDNIGRSEQNALGRASLPWWALTFGIGAEFG
jgi:hypothetical protein